MHTRKSLRLRLCLYTQCVSKMSSDDAISSAVGAPQFQSDLELWPETVVLLQSVVTIVHTNPSGHSDRYDAGRLLCTGGIMGKTRERERRGGGREEEELQRTSHQFC